MTSIEFETEIKQIERIYTESESTINLLDELMNARDELFENRLKNGLKAHNDLMKRLRSDLPHLS